ncbi:hypothetical protein F5148DRAFT_1164346 [Russula earlei]|uniref:Uncharacterized protein n=1 Tax=Russula earlei TaxID=71964 RepID=A0ACC0ULH2_9AGAM|nr:hypothetical protein F5148DRAFT_1164346 [Russula earlei]
MDMAWHGTSYLRAVHGTVGILTQIVLSDLSHAPDLNLDLTHLLSRQIPPQLWEPGPPLSSPRVAVPTISSECATARLASSSPLQPSGPTSLTRRGRLTAPSPQQGTAASTGKACSLRNPASVTACPEMHWRPGTPPIAYTYILHIKAVA